MSCPKIRPADDKFMHTTEPEEWRISKAYLESRFLAASHRRTSHTLLTTLGSLYAIPGKMTHHLNGQGKMSPTSDELPLVSSLKWNKRKQRKDATLADQRIFSASKCVHVIFRQSI